MLLKYSSINDPQLAIVDKLLPHSNIVASEREGAEWLIPEKDLKHAHHKIS